MAANRRSLVAGSVAGALAWILGYVFTYLLTASDIRDSLGSNVLELFQGDPATMEIVGWVFYNAHFVETVFADIGILPTESASYIGGDPGFTPWLYVIPIGLLVAAGLAAGRMAGADEAGEGVIAGVSVVPGYLLLALVGIFVFTLDIAGGTASPDLVLGVVLAGIVYPALCGGLGGAIAGLAPS